MRDLSQELLAVTDICNVQEHGFRTVSVNESLSNARADLLGIVSPT
jgi:hypothetical protein